MEELLFILILIALGVGRVVLGGIQKKKQEEERQKRLEQLRAEAQRRSAAQPDEARARPAPRQVPRPGGAVPVMPKEDGDAMRDPRHPRHMQPQAPSSVPRPRPAPVRHERVEPGYLPPGLAHGRRQGVKAGQDRPAPIVIPSRKPGTGPKPAIQAAAARARTDRGARHQPGGMRLLMPGTIAQSIVVSEILGPPKALRDDEF